MDPKKSKNISPRIKVIQKLYNSLMNPDAEIDYPKSQYKKFIKDVVKGTLERSDLIQETVNTYLTNDINHIHLENFQNLKSCGFGPVRAIFSSIIMGSI